MIYFSLAGELFYTFNKYVVFIKFFSKSVKSVKKKSRLAITFFIVLYENKYIYFLFI